MISSYHNCAVSWSWCIVFVVAFEHIRFDIFAEMTLSEHFVKGPESAGRATPVLAKLLALNSVLCFGVPEIVKVVPVVHSVVSKAFFN